MNGSCLWKTAWFPQNVGNTALEQRILRTSHQGQLHWLNGPDWLWNKTIEEDVNEEDVSEPEDCKVEMKSKDSTHSLVAIGTGAHSEMNLDKIICITRHSSAYRLFRVTALVLRFIALMFRLVNRHTKSMPSSEAQISTEEIERAKLLWIIDMQSQLTERKQFPVWKEQFGLFLDEKGG